MKTPEEQADELLHEFARSEGKSLRKLGIIDARRQRTIDEREIPMSDLMGNADKKNTITGRYEEDEEA